MQPYFIEEKRGFLMLSVNQLIQDAYESIGMAGLGESVGESGDDNLNVVGVKELNRLITQLNNEGYIAMSQKWVDGPQARVIYIRKLQDGETAPNTIDMEPPQKIESVARAVGDRFIVLRNSNLVDQSYKNPGTTALSWTYNTEVETQTMSDHGQRRLVGILTLDGDPRNKVRIWYNSKLSSYTLEDTIYLSDLYNEVLLAGLCNRLANYFELSEEKKASTASDFLAAKSMIKRNNITQRMLQTSQLGSDWRDSYNIGLSGS
jgi:hypothetical protein